MNIWRFLRNLLSFYYSFSAEHPLVVKAKLIVDDLEKARVEDPLFSPHFIAKCGLALSKELVIRDEHGMNSLKVREVYNLINHISMMVNTQELRIAAANAEKRTMRMKGIVGPNTF